MTVLLFFFTGIIVGAMNSIAGGGMLIGFPVLLASGISPLVANATGNIIILPGQLSSAFGYRKYLRKVPARYLLLTIPCLIGAGIGATVLRHTTSNSFERLVPGLIVFAVLLFALQPFLHRHIHRHLHGPKKHQQRLQPLLITMAIILPLSIYGGYFGPGFGFIMLAFLSFTKVHEIHQMNALKNVMAICIAGASIACLYSSGLIDWRAGLPMAMGNLLGGYAGSIGAQKVSSHAMRMIVIAIGSITAGYLVFRTY